MSETGRATDAEAREYFAAVESAFIGERGTPFLLSPKDFALMKSWRELAVPVEDVVAGIREAFARRRERGAGGRINSLSYCEGAVLEAWERGASARVGRPAGTAEAPAPAARLADLAEACAGLAASHPDLAAASERAAESIRRLAGETRSVERAEDALARLEKRLLREAEAALPEGERQRIEREVSALLAGEEERMDRRAIERTAAILRRQRVRRYWDVPRLTLL